MIAFHRSIFIVAALCAASCAQKQEVPRDVTEKIAGLHSSDATVRGTAAYALGRMGPRALPAAPDLISLLADDVQLVREPEGRRTSVSVEADAALSAIGEKNIDAALFLDALKRQPWNGRDNVAEHLKYTGDPRAIPAMVDALLEPGEDWPEIGFPDLSPAAMAERSLAPPSNPVEHARSMIAHGLETAVGRVRERGGKVVVPQKRLTDALKNENRSIRKNAAVALRAVGDASAIEPLLAIVRDPSAEHELRVIATYSLSGIHDPRVVPPLIAATTDADPAVRGAAIRALGECRDRRAMAALTAALKDSNNRGNAVTALASVGGTSTVPLLLSLLDDRDAGTREAAVRALGELRDERAADPLIALLERERLDYVRESIGTSLQQITHEDRGKDAAAWKRWRGRKWWEFWK